MCVATGDIFAVKGTLRVLPSSASGHHLISTSAPSEIDKHKHKANAKTMLLFEREIEILGTLKHVRTIFFLCFASCPCI